MQYQYDIKICKTFWQLLVRSFIVYKPNFKDKIINALIWIIINIVVFGFIMKTSMSYNFGSFMLISTAATQPFFTAINHTFGLISEINGENSSLQYELTLPIPQSFIFAKYALEYAYQGFIISAFMVPIGLLFLWNEFSFQYFSIFKFHFMLFIAALFSGFFGLWIASITKDVFHGYENLWGRIIFPLWFLGGFQFSWKQLHSLAPKIAYLNLLNPLTYILEGARAAAIDPSLSLPYWNCVSVILVFTILFGYLGIKTLQKRLDCL